MNRAEHRLDTSGRRVVDVTDLVADFCLEDGRDGLVHAFVPHATAGLALMETRSGSNATSRTCSSGSCPGRTATSIGTARPATAAITCSR